MLLFPARRRAPMARLRQVAMARGAEPVRSVGGVLGERHVSDVVQGFDLPVTADQPSELGGCGLFRSEAGDRVDGLDGDRAGLAVHSAAFELDGLAGAGKEQAVRRAHLDAADLTAAVAGVVGAALQRYLLPGKGFELLVELLLVPFRDHDVLACSRWVCMASLITTTPARSARVSSRGWKQVISLVFSPMSS
jgi:hypothetical protein